LTTPEPRAFAEAWEAEAFAIAVKLSERGLFTWSEWTEALGAELKHQNAAEGEAGYYKCWLAVLEKLVVAKGAARSGELEALAKAWLAAADATPHGKPIVLGAEKRPRP
jgi:nitrile hydratase accessory protein